MHACHREKNVRNHLMHNPLGSMGTQGCQRDNWSKISTKIKKINKKLTRYASVQKKIHQKQDEPQCHLRGAVQYLQSWHFLVICLVKFCIFLLYCEIIYFQTFFFQNHKKEAEKSHHSEKYMKKLKLWKAKMMSKNKPTFKNHHGKRNMMP